MDDKDLKEFTEHLIKTAEKGKHKKLDLIKNKKEFIAYIILKHSTKTVVTGFKKEASSFMDQYIEALENKVDNLQLLVNSKLFEKYAEFYLEEVDLVTDKINEFIAYMFSGNLLKTIFGGQRADRDLRDFTNFDYLSLFEEDEDDDE